MEYQTKALPLDESPQEAWRQGLHRDVSVDDSPKTDDSRALVRYYEQQGTVLLQQARALKIVDQDSREAASEFVLRTRENIKKIKDWREPVIKKAYELHRSLTAERNQLVKPFEDAQRLVDAEISRDFMEQKRLEREAREKAEREAKAAEEREKARLDALALKQMERGDMAKAEQTMARAEQVFVAPAAPPPTIKTTATAYGSTTMKLDFDVQVVDMKALCGAIASGKVPGKVLSLALAEMKAYIKGNKDGDVYPVIPGVVITEKARTSGRVA